MSSWTRDDLFYYHHTPWVTFLGEHLIDDQQRRLEYYRVEKAASVIVLPLQERRLYAPPRQYRPGVGRSTLDFPGGRVPPDTEVREAAAKVLERELGVPPQVARIESLYGSGFLLNSSFSNQKLFAAVARIAPDFSIAPEMIGGVWTLGSPEIKELLGELECAQCRLTLLEYLYTGRQSG